MGSEEKIILVIERKKLFGVGEIDTCPQGFLPVKTYDYSPELNSESEWKRRGRVNESPEISMESNPLYKQPIAYSVLFDKSKQEIFAYQRHSQGLESRLQDKWSWGIGGHVEQLDQIPGYPVMDIIERSRRRELEEEVGINNDKADLIGYINDDNNSVGKVHFGLVYFVTTSPSEVTLKDELKQGNWISINDIRNSCFDIERWSELLIDPLKDYLKTNYPSSM